MIPRSSPAFGSRSSISLISLSPNLIFGQRTALFLNRIQKAELAFGRGKLALGLVQLIPQLPIALDRVQLLLVVGFFYCLVAAILDELFYDRFIARVRHDD